jgi:DNA-directed RNA polymerase alpha subunit
MNKEGIQLNNETLNEHIDSLDLSIGLYNCLKSKNIQTLGDIVSYSEDFFSNKTIPGFFTSQKKELNQVLKEKGLKYKEMS